MLSALNCRSIRGGYIVAAAIATVTWMLRTITVIVSGREYAAHTTIDGEVFADAVTGTEGEAVEVLAAVHIGVDVVAVETEGAIGVAEGAEEGDFAFEAAETVLIGGFTPTADESEVELKAEGTVDPSGLERGNDGRFGFGLEELVA